ncbi:MAG TPA: type II toxin-antitoxin system VapC family toxin [Stellaceae bacterium]|nr:type II toxin-antitoxin system VapC family toxin [Stellaceae bacterium]
MIVIDTSAIIAILREESDARSFIEIIADSERSFLSAVGFFEASIVMIGRGPQQLADGLDALIEHTAMEIVPVNRELARESRAAFIRFGKGRHPARLNFGDCVSYALAQSRGLPLLYKGDDFAKTDVISAVR